MRICARVALDRVVCGVGGARVGALPSIPGRPGVLILMNHQSLLDIPLGIRCTADHYPLIVTRKRYASGIPLVSHMLRLYGFPLVEPGARAREQLVQLAATARSADRPLLIFPEGGRTRDGSIREFRRGGLESILPQRRWETYVLVGDGFWRCARLTEYVSNISAVRGSLRCAGPFPFDPALDAPGEFAQRMREQMITMLGELRGAAARKDAGDAIRP